MLVTIGLLATLGLVAYYIRREHEVLRCRVNELIDAQQRAAFRIVELERQVQFISVSRRKPRLIEPESE